MLIELLKRIYTGFNNRILFNPEAVHPSIEAQEAYLNAFPEPPDAYERSYQKYQCLSFYHYNGKCRFFLDFCSLLALMLLLPYYFLSGAAKGGALRRYTPKHLLLSKEGSNLPADDIYPSALEQMYGQRVRCCTGEYSRIYLAGPAVSIFFHAALRHPIRFHYLLVTLIRLSQHCALLVQYSPCCVTTYVCEREFADPLVTLFCEKLGVRYEGFMHGDYLYSVDKAFLQLSRYWIWDEHYRRLFRRLRCDMPMELYRPGKYTGIVKPRPRSEDYPYYATYYFGDETHTSAQIVKGLLDSVAMAGKRCKVRPHPRFSDAAYLRELFGDEMMEDPQSVSIAASLEETYYAIAVVSTVLSQAYYSGKPIILDDLSKPELFAQLRKADYILLDKADMLLSEWVDNIVRSCIH